MSSLSLPTLRLRIAKSRIRWLLWLALCAACLAAIALLFVRGHFALAVGAGVFYSYRLAALGRAERCGLSLVWQDANVAIGSPAAEKPQRCVYANTTLPWAVYLELVAQSDTTKTALWVFSDSLSPRDFRRLRVRTRLAQPATGGY
ncbi:MAG: hypothetical protein NXI15_01915 [Gammaproteobacteria bacterium]|nr:hypothetical protein [Gammaproteobacteria bacterium]